MRVTTRMAQSKRTRLAALSLGLTSALALSMAGPASAQQERLATVEPYVIAGNPTCGDLAQNGFDPFVGSEDVDPPVDATDIPVESTDGTLTGTLDVDFSANLLTLNSFNFEGELVAGAVIVKGGNNGNVYDYRATGGIAADENLVAPLNNPGNQPQISHVTFCFYPANGS
ncbi:hypothetical protein AB0I77_31140 [Streptomyces sp. NPDC050619]|uniref:hypothetical protein n=1 Tax=Streptomyces sp. NPDC050619 TaxID=3157214 RepID=UPI00342D5BA0